MKAKTKAGLLKTRGFFKKAAIWTPLVGTLLGLAGFISLIAVGATKETKTIEEFKSTPMFSEVYSQEYEEADRAYKAGEINIYQLNEKMNEINDEDYPKKVLKNAGEEAAEYKASLKSASALMWSSSAGAALAFGSPFLLFPWFLGPEVARKLSNSSDRDYERAEEILDQLQMEKDVKNDIGQTEDGEEERLPNIGDTYYD